MDIQPQKTETTPTARDPVSPVPAARTATGREESLSHYLRQIRLFPILNAQEEIKLAKCWHKGADEKAFHRLVNSHLRLVVKAAVGYRGYGLPLSDLIAEGNIGLIEAVRRFDPQRGFRLSTYAVWWIRAAMQEYILRSWSLVKIGTTAAQKKLFFNLRSLKNRLKELGDASISTENTKYIARELNVSEWDVISINARITGPDCSLNATTPEGNTEWIDGVRDESSNQEQAYAEWEELSNRRALLLEGLGNLAPRERLILEKRWLEERPCTLEMLSKHLGISRERVRQVEKGAFTKLQKVVHNLGWRRGPTGNIKDLGT